MSKKRHEVARRVRDPEASVAMRTLAVGYSSGHVLEEHAHDGWSQLVYATAGVMTVRTASGSWVVPPQRAVWVPAGLVHEIEMSGDVSMRTVYVRRSLSRGLPRDCCVVNVSPLLRELIVEAVRIGLLDRSVAVERHLAGMILDQLHVLPSVPLQLPMPQDARAREVAQVLWEDPSDASPVDALSSGTSKRTLERIFVTETGMTFGAWRQQLRLLHAVRLLAAGKSVTTVALDTGYESPSAFIAMFKRALGTTPGRYSG